MTVRVLRQADVLIVSLPPYLTDSGWQDLRNEVLEPLARFRARGVVIDVSAMDAMDSYATRLLDGVARMVSLKGAQAVVVGVQPGVAFAMAQLGLQLASAATALDLDDGLAWLSRARRSHGG